MSLPASVLLIDDDKTNNFLNERQLRRLDPGLAVHTAESGQDALDWLAQPSTAAPDLILLDVNMPGMGGLEFLQRFHQRHAGYDPVVVVLTTTTSSLELLPFAPLRVAQVLTKPLTGDKLALVLAQHFSSSAPSA